MSWALGLVEILFFSIKLTVTYSQLNDFEKWDEESS